MGLLGQGRPKAWACSPSPFWFVVINLLGILKGHSWVAAGPVFAQTGMMSAYSLWSSAILGRIPGAYRASPGCWPAHEHGIPLESCVSPLAYLRQDFCCSRYKHWGMRSNLKSSLHRTCFSSPVGFENSAAFLSPFSIHKEHGMRYTRNIPHLRCRIWDYKMYPYFMTTKKETNTC